MRKMNSLGVYLIYLIHLMKDTLIKILQKLDLLDLKNGVLAWNTIFYPVKNGAATLNQSHTGVFHYFFSNII